jgi:thiol-disulfide isomerase/thioredoxin
MRTAVLTLLCIAAAGSARVSPPFTILRQGKPPLALSQYRGKVVALAFIQTTCPHCQILTTVLNSIARDYALRGVQVLECAFNDDARRALPDFLQQFHPAFPVGWSNRATVMAYLQYTIIEPRPLYVPHMVFLDRRGVIQGDYPGESDFFRDPNTSIRAELEKLLK